MPETDTAYSPQVTAAAAAAPPIQVLPGNRGPGLILRGAAVHAREDPAAEAAAWVKEVVGRWQGAGGAPELALVFGLGLGWHLRRLKELFPKLRVAVFEPDKGFLETFEKYNVLGRGDALRIFTDPGEFDRFTSSEVVYSDAVFPLLMVTPGYHLAFPREAARFMDKVGEAVGRLKVIVKTKKATMSAFMDNLVENAWLATRLPDLMLLKGRFMTRPAFAVGAGPSLTQNGALLRGLGDKGLVIAAAAALKPLLRLGVCPDVVVVIESSDTSRFLRLTPEEKAKVRPGTVLAAALGSHPEHFRAEGFDKALFHLSGGEAQLLSQGYFLPQGGNAGTACFAFAYVWGLSPVVLVGQDQAYLGPQLHAEGTVDSLFEADRFDSIRIPGIGGTAVESNTGLAASVNWLAEAAALILSKGKGPRLINSSAHGAAVKGFEEIPLEAVVANLPAQPKTWTVSEAMRSLPRPSARELRGDLKQMSSLLSQTRQLVNRNVQRALVEMMNISKVSAFMGELLAPALAGGNRQGILKNIAWADGVILKMLASLEKGGEA
ncbi:MAG: DUF115 domain-containing protein [Deltaproteobacteria bacterium]|jgi:hypothetical protein|nr:DUF115 domain-containing protein [Deltaproteobacteria bacterium]